MCIRSPEKLIELERTPQSQVVLIIEYRLLNQLLSAHVVSKRCRTVH